MSDNQQQDPIVSYIEAALALVPNTGGNNDLCRKALATASQSYQAGQTGHAKSELKIAKGLAPNTKASSWIKKAINQL